MLRSRQILRRPDFASGRKRVEAMQVIRGLTQGQALRAALYQLYGQNMKNSERLLLMSSNRSEGYDFIFQNQYSFFILRLIN
jgi:hypothetical protein